MSTHRAWVCLTLNSAPYFAAAMLSMWKREIYLPCFLLASCVFDPQPSENVGTIFFVGASFIIQYYVIHQERIRMSAHFYNQPRLHDNFRLVPRLLLQHWFFKKVNLIVILISFRAALQQAWSLRRWELLLTSSKLESWITQLPTLESSIVL